MPEKNKYVVLHELGAGGMGKIYKGLLIGQAGFQRPIVIKQLRHSDEPGHVGLFVEEARRYALLDHENIGRIFDFEEVSGELCIILEYIDGWSLVEFVERHRELERMPDVVTCVFIVSRVCRALQYVFETARIVHRDISPSNIMMTRQGAVKLIDFGIATRSGTRDSSLTGKPAYMAPEMVVELRADNRSDVFSLGTVFFEMLTRERLFTGNTTAAVLEQVISGHQPSPRSLGATVPEGCMAILHKALQRDPGQRFATAGEMGEACEHLLYDKGYGPTNLTLKEYLATLFPESFQAAAPPEAGFPRVEPTLIPIGDGERPRKRVRDGDETPVSRPRVTPLPDLGTARGDTAPGTLAPDPGRRPRRLKRS